MKAKENREEKYFSNACIFKDECFKDNTDNNPSHKLSHRCTCIHTHIKNERTCVSVVCDQVRN